jgi:hypothetical protein
MFRDDLTKDKPEDLPATQRELLGPHEQRTNGPHNMLKVSHNVYTLLIIVQAVQS